MHHFCNAWSTSVWPAQRIHERIALVRGGPIFFRECLVGVTWGDLDGDLQTINLPSAGWPAVRVAFLCGIIPGHASVPFGDPKGAGTAPSMECGRLDSSIWDPAGPENGSVVCTYYCRDSRVSAV
jgi:hypothetical protein